MSKKSYLWGLAIFGFVALSMGACKDDSAAPGESAGGDDGLPQAGGAGTLAGTGGDDGRGGAAGEGGSVCSSPTLAEHCRAVTCPASPSQVELVCGRATWSTVQRTSSCGGVSVIRDYGLGGDVWHFNANDELVGIEVISDELSDCAPTGLSYFGERCTLTGLEIDLCNGMGGAGGSEAGAGG